MHIMKLPPNSGAIYMYTFDNNKAYIGQTINLRDRYNVHKTGCLAVDNAIRKHDYIFQVLEVLPINELDAEEERLIKVFNTLSPNGYNIATGGKTGNRGGGSVRALDVSVFNAKTGKYLGTYPSCYDAGAVFNATKGQIAKCCRVKGYTRNHTLCFRYASDYPDNVLPEDELYKGRSQEWTGKLTKSRMDNWTEEKRKNLSEAHKGFKRKPESIRKTVETKRELGIGFGKKPRAILAYDYNTGEYLLEFPSAKKAAEYYDVDPRTIFAILNGVSKALRYKRITFRYKED